MKVLIIWLFSIFQVFQLMAQENNSQMFQTCNFLSRYFGKEKQPALIEILQNYKDTQIQQKAWNKLFVVLITMCQEKLTSDEQSQVLGEMQEGTFQLSKYLHIYEDFDFAGYKIYLDIEMNDEEKKLQKTIDEFERLMQEQQAAQGGVDKNAGQDGSQNSKPKRDRGGKKPSATKQDKPLEIQGFLVIGSFAFILTMVAYLSCFTTQQEKKQKVIRGKVNIGEKEE